MQVVSVAFDNGYTAIVLENERFLLYENEEKILKDILQDSAVRKLFAQKKKNIIEYAKKYNMKIVNYENINLYLNNRSGHLLIPLIRKDLEKCNCINDDVKRLLECVYTITKYKKIIDETTKISVPSTFNKKRDAYLLYLTIINDILSQFGPSTLCDVFRKAKKYPELIRNKTSIETAVKALIHMNALVLANNKLYLPDQVKK